MGADMWEEAFVDNMVRERQGRGMSQTELAKRVAAQGVPCHQQTIARIEDRQRSVRLNEAQALTQVLFAGDWLEATMPLSVGDYLATLVRHSRQARERLEHERERWLDVAADWSLRLMSAVKDRDDSIGAAEARHEQELWDAHMRSE